VHSQFIRGIFSHSTVDVGLYVDRGRPGHFRHQHIFMPFFGGPDDRLALGIVVQLCAKPGATATIMRVQKAEFTPPTPEPLEPAHTVDKGEGVTLQEHYTINSISGFPDTIYGATTTQTRIQSQTADQIAWQSYANPREGSITNPLIRDALTRIKFIEISSSKPMHEVLARAQSETDVAIQKKARPFVVVGRARRLAAESHQEELRTLLEENGHLGSEVRKTMGDVATAFVLSGGNAGLLVVQTGMNDNER